MQLNTQMRDELMNWAIKNMPTRTVETLAKNNGTFRSVPMTTVTATFDIVKRMNHGKVKVKHLSSYPFHTYPIERADINGTKRTVLTVHASEWR